MTALGVDLFNGNSKGYNAPQTLTELRAAGGKPFITHKGSQGWAGGPGGWIDWVMQDAVSRFRAAGCDRISVYHWALKGNGDAQADLACRAADLAGGRNRVPIDIDYERNDWNQGLNPDWPTLVDIVNGVRRRGGTIKSIYAAPWYTDGPYPGTFIRDHTLAPIWWAGYDGNVSGQPIGTAWRDVTPNWMPPWDGYTAYDFRQFSSDVRVAGNGSDVDISFLPENVLDQKFLVAHAPPPPPPAPSGYHRFDGYPLLSATAPHNLDTTTGGKVHVWQNAINVVSGRGLQVDGVFGPATAKATQDFEAITGIGRDAGVVGAQCWGTMAKLLTDTHRVAFSMTQRLEELPPDHDLRAALPETHILHPSYHFNQGEHYRRAADVLV